MLMKSLFRYSLWLLLGLPVSLAGAPPGAAIATAHPYATEAGEQILQAGGNAFDAAVAVTAALAVVEPYASGLGGGGFWLLHRAEDGKQIMIDGRETAPSSATKTMYLDEQGEPSASASLNGPLASGIPGVPAGLEYLAKQYGRLPLSRSLEPAINYAEQGFPVTERYQKLAKYRVKVMQTYPTTATIFLQEKQVPALGHMIIQKDLARTLKQIAKNGAAAFYTGNLAVSMVRAVRHNGGIWLPQDLAAYRIIARQPSISQYHELRIISASPPSSGGIALAQILGILEQFDLNSYDDAGRKHIIIEAMRRAYADRAVYLGDPDFTQVPEQRLLSKEYLVKLAATIDPARATPSKALGNIPVLPPVGTETSHFSIIDKVGNRVAATLSINLPFGSGFTTPGTGILLNNEMDDFAAKANVPNAYNLLGNEANSIAAGKRPLSSMSPTFVETDDKVGILGTPGGSRIISMVLLGILDFAAGNLPDSWVSRPRYHHQYFPDEVQFEPGGLPSVQQQALRKRGHILKEKNRRYGNMQAILWDKKADKLFAASDPRGEGKAKLIGP